MDGRSQVQATDDSYFSRLGKELMITLISVRVNTHFSYARSFQVLKRTSYYGDYSSVFLIACDEEPTSS
jgi:hypothetical protein